MKGKFSSAFGNMKPTRRPTGCAVREKRLKETHRVRLRPARLGRSESGLKERNAWESRELPSREIPREFLRMVSRMEIKLAKSAE